MNKAFLFEVWDIDSNREVLVIAKNEEEATKKISCIICEGEDYDLSEHCEYDEILV